MKSKSLLFIPSWYPTVDNKFIGNNYRLQIELFSKQFNVNILYGTPTQIGLLSLYKLFKINKTAYFELHAPPSGIGFKYYQVRIPKSLQGIKGITSFFEKFNYVIQGKAYLKELKKLMNNDFKPDIIHAFSTQNAGIASFYLSKKLNIPYVISEHQVFVLDSLSDKKRSFVKNALIHANKVLPVSEHQNRQILMNYIPCSSIVIGNFIDDELFKPAPQKKQDLFTIITVTYDSFIKDNDTFFKAVQLFKEKSKTDFKLILVGGNFSGKKIDKTENPLYKYVKEYNLEQESELISFVNKSDMVNYYNQSDVFISTSIAETFGMSQCEALMCGIPVISTSNGGIDDILGANSGIKVPLRNHKHIAEALLKIKNEEIKFNREEIRDSVVKKFGREAFFNRLSDIYLNTIQ